MTHLAPEEPSDPTDMVTAVREAGGPVARLEQLKPDARVEGLVVGSSVAVVATTWHGLDTLEVVYRAAEGL